MKNVTIYQLHGHMGRADLPNAFNQMMSYIIQTGNGKLIVIDGGYACEAPYLLETLKKLGGDKPTIAAWLHTHMHVDHVEAFAEIMEHHFDELKINGVYYNFPTREELFAYGQDVLQTYDYFFKNYSKFAHISHLVEVSDMIEIDDVKFEVLFVPRNRYAKSNNLNNSSVVYRMEACEQTMLFLGDLAEAAQEDFLNETDHQKINSDIVQMAHHGQYGVQKVIYEAICPQCCFWDAPNWLWDNNPGTGFNTGVWQTVTVRGWMQDLGVKHHIVHKNGTQKLVLPADFSDLSWGQEPMV